MFVNRLKRHLQYTWLYENDTLLSRSVPCTLCLLHSWLVHDPSSQLTAVVDPAESQPVEQALKAK
jgi:hypothetical protein